MDVMPTELSGLLLIGSRCFHDESGFLLERFQVERYSDNGIKKSFVQDRLGCLERFLCWQSLAACQSYRLGRDGAYPALRHLSPESSPHVSAAL
jgi:hypothetical protein